jgi:hypothetical protein
MSTDKQEREPLFSTKNRKLLTNYTGKPDYFCVAKWYPTTYPNYCPIGRYCFFSNPR